MGSLRTNPNNCHGVVSNHLVVEWKTIRAYKFGAMVGFIPDSLGEDGCEGVNSVQLVIRDDHGLGGHCRMARCGTRKEVNIMGLFEEASDHIGHHVGLLCFRGRVGGVKDCDDGSEGNCFGKGNFRVIGAF